MFNKEELLKKLLKNILDERIKRLEKRASEQIDDINYEKNIYNSQILLISKLSSINIKKDSKSNHQRRNTYEKPIKKILEKSIKRTTQINNDKKKTKTISKTPTVTILRKKKQNKNDGKLENNEKPKTPLKIKKVINVTDMKKLPSNIKNSKASLNSISKSTNKNSTKTEPKRPVTPERKIKDLKLKKEKIKIDDKKLNLTAILENKSKINEENKTFNLIVSNDILINTISGFLDEENQYNFFSCNKSLIKYLYNKLNISYNILKERNGISPSSTIENKINSIKMKFGTQVIGDSSPPLSLSKGTIKALEILNDAKYKDIFKNKDLNPPLNEIIIVYRIFFQLMKDNNLNKIKDDKIFWKTAAEYILSNCKDNLGDFFSNSLNYFDLRYRNIYEIQKIVHGNEDKIKPVVFSNICATTGLVIFLIKDVLEYLGIIINYKKNIPRIMIKYLEYINNNKNTLENYISKIKNAALNI